MNVSALAAFVVNVILCFHYRHVVLVDNLITHSNAALLEGVHTNNIESAWLWAKAFLKNRKIKTDVSLHLHLQCYMWRVWKGRPHAEGCFGRLMEDIAAIYPQI